MRNAENAFMYGSSASFGTFDGGPAGTWITRMPAPMCATSGRCGLSQRVNTSTSTPSRASCLATFAT